MAPPSRSINDRSHDADLDPTCELLSRTAAVHVTMSVTLMIVREVRAPSRQLRPAAPRASGGGGNDGR
jgi:hypothetical protein